jgi:hypothetical protein
VQLKGIILPVVLLALLGTTFFSMTLFSIAVHAVDQDQRLEHGANDDAQHREVDGVQSNETGFIHSTLQSGVFDNKFAVSLDTTDGPSLRLESSNVNDVRDSPNQANPSISIVYKNLVEFKDNDGNGSYEPGIDTAIQSINLEELNYSKPALSRMVSQDGKQGWELKTHSINNLFTVSTKTFSETRIVDGTQVAPTTSEITVTINQFPFRDNASRLALQTLVASGTPIVQESVSGRAGLGLGSGTTREFLSWNPTISVNTRTVSVVSTSSSSTNGILVNLAYPNGNTIVQELFFGVSFGQTPLLNTSVLIGSGIIAVVMFGLLIIVGRRRILGARLGYDFS